MTVELVSIAVSNACMLKLKKLREKIRDEAQPKNLYWLGLVLLIVLVDQILKQIAYKNLSLYEIVPLFSWLNITLQFNTGAAFSFLSDAGGWQHWLFTGIAIVMSLGMLLWLYILPRQQKFMALALTFIMAGAIGNLIDRLNHGFVIDYVDFHLRDWHFAVFNLADASITVGAFVFLCCALFAKEES